ncbi:unnamed protein product [Orchesella dallaii]|uniref:Uncharacterized protein n=1 Tax=Orchesella dallaii TaxID=48710 RepID=A0ABP1QBI8_9HEXA
MFSSSNVRLGGRVWRLQKTVKEVQQSHVPSSAFSLASTSRYGNSVDRNSATQTSFSSNAKNAQQDCNNRKAS